MEVLSKLLYQAVQNLLWRPIFLMLSRANSAGSMAVLAMAIVLSFSILIPQLQDMFGVKISWEEAIEFIKRTDHPINENMRWQEIKAAGIKVTETSWKGFLQICERLVIDFGNFRIYIDGEARIIWVWADPSAPESEKEAYYVQFG